MQSYEEMYIKMFKQVSKTIEDLQAIQQVCEEIYVSDESLESEIAKLECDFSEFCGEQRDED